MHRATCNLCWFAMLAVLGSVLVHGLVTCGGRSRGSRWYVVSRFVTLRVQSRTY